MNKEKIREAIQIIEAELTSEELDADMAIYQIYCTCNTFIANEIKRIIQEEGEVTSEHPEIKPLYKFFDYILPVMKRYSNMINQREEEKEKNVESNFKSN